MYDLRIKNEIGLMQEHSFLNLFQCYNCAILTSQLSYRLTGVSTRPVWLCVNILEAFVEALIQ